MGKSPGHLQNPDHHVNEARIAHKSQVMIDGEVVAESREVIRVDEDGHPPRYYFPREDVHVDKLERSETLTRCPFKGAATYYHVTHGDKRLRDAIWSYEDPYDEHMALKGRLAFYDDKHPEIRIIEKADTL
jgi:uncharacterized protein (DUF427 family)